MSEGVNYMNKTLSFVRLDYITIKPYITLKNLLIFFGGALIMIISSGVSVSAIAILMAYASLYVSYPFAIGEKNSIDALYATLSIKRSTAVLGRYVFALTVNVFAGLLACSFSFVVLTVMQKDFNVLESGVVMLVMLLLCIVIQAVQFPIYYKIGYAKAMYLSYLPFVGLFLITLAVTNFLKDSFSLPQIISFFGWFTANPFVAALLGFFILAGILVVSYRTSLKYYNMRDF